MKSFSPFIILLEEELCGMVNMLYIQFSTDDDDFVDKVRVLSANSVHSFVRNLIGVDFFLKCSFSFNPKEEMGSKGK